MKNESNLDRLVRGIAGIALVVLGYFMTSGALQIVAYSIAAILLITAITGFCGLYKVLGIKTN